MAVWIGDKSTFAIEAHLQQRAPMPFGNVRLWLENRYLGAYEDSVPMLVTLASLKRLLDQHVAFDDASLPSREAFFAGVMDGSMRDGDRYRAGLGESFDDFLVIGFRCGDRIRFIWVLHENPFFDYPAYPEGLQDAWISVALFQDVVERFERVVAPRSADD